MSLGRFSSDDFQSQATLASGGRELTTRGQDLALQTAVEQARHWLLDQQHSDGYWLGELEGDSILESEYILLLTWMGRAQSEIVKQAAAYIQQLQRPEGGWSLYPGGPLEVSASVKAYWAMKIAGYDPQSAEMVKAREAILAAGGAEKVNSFTRYYLALLGVISYHQCPAVPPEVVLLPTWMPCNIYEMSAWSRTILIPLSLLWAYQPVTKLAPEHNLRELFLNSPEQLPVSMPPAENLDPLSTRTWIDWGKLFRRIDRGWKLLECWHLKPLRKRAVRQAQDWMLERFQGSDGLGAIFPPIIWSIVALRCLGYAEDSPEVVAALTELEKLTIREGQTARLEPCRSPVWDTALSLLALRDAGVSASHPQIQRGVDWLLAKEVRRTGDWAVSRGLTKPSAKKNGTYIEPSGWCFEFQNEFYPDIDDTIMVLMALARCLPGEGAWSAQLAPFRHNPSKSQKETDLGTVTQGRVKSPSTAVQQIESQRPLLAALQRGVKWVFAMQCRNGGWGAFDANNDREIFTRVPFADHNAMIDPATADITARTLEMCGRLGVEADLPAVRQALEFVWKSQETDGAWYGRWGINYVYGTWQVLVGLAEIGVSPGVLRASTRTNALARLTASIAIPDHNAHQTT